MKLGSRWRAEDVFHIKREEDGGGSGRVGGDYKRGGEGRMKMRRGEATGEN